ncbi:MAG: COX15/CtaA family protein [Gammaproteobacteria bacterium]
MRWRPAARAANALTANPLATWLSLCCLLVFALVVLGGAVRLSGSGLSMVEWRPLAGVVPPLGRDAWQLAFEKYRHYPEFRLLNPDMTPAGFRAIFLMEYAHRMLGRITALAFLLPFLFFLWRRMLPRALAARLWLVFLLGGLQGLLGWHMVQSGLADDPRVSHYRLAMHLALAVTLYAYMLRLAIGLRAPAERAMGAAALRASGAVAVAMIFVMMISGALVAGTHAGQAYNTWPKMGGRWLPPQLLALRPWWLNFFENLSAIQFTHRWLAMVTLLALGGFALQLFRAGKRALAGMLLMLVAAQILLGIVTLRMRVPFALGVAHQTGAMVLLSVSLAALVARLRPLRFGAAASCKNAG